MWVKGGWPDGNWSLHLTGQSAGASCRNGKSTFSKDKSGK